MSHCLPFIRACAGAALVAFVTTAGAITAGKTARGGDYATGGITASELRTLADDKDQYSLWITTAAKGSGAYLSDVQVKITDAKNEVVLDTLMIGPYLFVDLDPGAYTIEAKFNEQTRKRKLHIGRNDHEQAILYFDSPADVSPDWVSPFESSPYATK